MSTIVSPIDAERLVINIGPSHPVTHGTLRIQVELDGETITASGFEIGYLHRGFEKQAENVFYEHVVPYAERLNYMGPVLNSNAWCYAVEQMLGIEAPPRAQVLRVMTSEMGRIIDHCVCIGANMVDLGGLTNFWYLYNYREKIYDLYEELCGARMMVNYPRIGGVAMDVPEGWLEKLSGVMADLKNHLADVQGLVETNRIFVDRTQGVCAISQQDALRYGMTGVCLRATGIPYDVRKTQPYWGYDTYDFEVPLGSHGDTYDRITLRFKEMEQSRRLVMQSIEKLPEGPHILDDPRYVKPAKDLVYNTMEGLISHFKIVMHGVSPARGEIYSATEGGNGELGFYIVSDGGPKAWRVRIRPPCFANYTAFPTMIKGAMLADAIAALGSVNIIAGELDR
jgi:NADH-quinone oxidoreductase subunit C/D